MFERREFVDKIRGLGKDNDQVLNVMRIIDKENNPQHYQEQKQEEQKSEPKRDRGMSR
ncbi:MULTISPECIES: hypothetical protein [Staphylococcus]|nr:MULTISPECIES: hypothetical protein [Staphylococcus]MCD0998854.1 hypothetical protein [Staphylococcus aureus]NGQ77887.1 hypothetical protein [Staphylococcus aureus]NGQ85839.1 hypothetical protein [Staphylococcus aureus]NUX44389.1 hypothetical protein [Staphylococcus aureus]